MITRKNNKMTTKYIENIDNLSSPFRHKKLTVVMKHPKTSPFKVSMASTVFLASPDLASIECSVAPSRRREYLSQKLLSEQLVGRCSCRAPMMGGVKTWGAHCLSFWSMPTVMAGIFGRTPLDDIGTALLDQAMKSLLRFITNIVCLSGRCQP